jgi:hypothetical protein
MKVTLALAFLLFASTVHAQVTASPTTFDFGTMFPGQFESQTITYTCVQTPCICRSNETKGHKVVASNNTCWGFDSPGGSGETCTITWTLLATMAEDNCPSNVCAGSISVLFVTGGLPGGGEGGSASSNYTATVLSPKPTMTFSPSSLYFGNILYGVGNSITLPVTVTNTSQVDEDLTWTEIGVGFGVDDPAGSTCAPNLPPGQSCQITVYFGGYDWCGTAACAVPEPNHGVLKIWDSSTTPGTPSKSVFVGEVPLGGTSSPYIPPPPPPGAQITASPTMIDFGTMYTGQFGSVPVTYTCVVAPCVWSADEIKGDVVASDNTCKSTWKQGETENGSTCTVNWTFLASPAEVNCPSGICTGSVGVKVVATEASGENIGIATSTYTATVLSPKPTLTVTPTELDFGDILINGGNVPFTDFVAVTNVSEVTVDVSATITTQGDAFYLYPPIPCPTALTIGQSCQIPVNFQGWVPNCNTAAGEICTIGNSGSLKIYGTSATPGTPTTQYHEGTVKLQGQATRAQE